MILGASGVFGSRLARLLAREPDVDLILAGRTAEKLAALAADFETRPEIAVLDRETISAADLSACRCDCVIDSAGPFQDRASSVIEAALGAGVHYLDLADGRDFVRDFPKHDARARAAHVALITGASSVPALSHAVIDQLVQGWRSVETIRVGIFPGNRAPRGLSVVESILSYAGKPVRVFRNGAWERVPGWGMTHEVELPRVGTRWASVCDTPDQDLLVARYKPTQSAEFFAGLELSILHLGLAFLSLFVRWRILPSLLPFAKPMLWVAQQLLPFGTDKGGMIVAVSGMNGNGAAQSVTWSLEADANHGPNVPILAAAILVRKLRDGEIAFRGARACTGFLTLNDFLDDFARFGLRTGVREK